MNESLARELPRGGNPHDTTRLVGRGLPAGKEDPHSGSLRCPSRHGREEKTEAFETAATRFETVKQTEKFENKTESSSGGTSSDGGSITQQQQQQPITFHEYVSYTVCYLQPTVRFLSCDSPVTVFVVHLFTTPNYAP